MNTPITNCKKCGNGFFKNGMLEDLCGFCRNVSSSNSIFNHEKIND